MEGDAKDNSEAVSINTDQVGENKTEVTSEAESPKVELRPSAPLGESGPDKPDAGSDSADSGDSTKFETVGSSKKIIEPSSEFRSEMTHDNGQDGTNGQSSVGVTESNSNINDSDMTPGDSDGSTEQHQTPDAVKDFINAEAPQGAEQASNDAPTAQSVQSEAVTQPETASFNGVQDPAVTSSAAPEASQRAAGPASSMTPNTAVVDTAAVAPALQPSTEAGKSSSGRGLMWIIIAAIVVIIGALAFVYLYYLPNRPGAVFNSSMSRTGQAIDKLVNYSQGNYLTDFQSFGLKGNVTLNGKNYNLASDLTGSYDKSGNSTTDLNVDSKTEGNTNSHLKVEFGLETIKPDGQAYPDVYFKLSGISDLLDQLGASSFDKYDGKWIVVSHDLIKSYADSATGSDSELKSPTKAQIFDAINKAQAVNKEYLFTSDQSKSIIVNKQYLGAETKFGRSTYHYKVGFNKTNMLAYVDALKSALNSSSLNDWAKASLKHDLIQTSDVKDAKAAVDKIKDGTTFDLWADRSTKLIEAVQFVEVDGSEKTVTTLAQTYDGGDNYPFKMIVSGSDSQSNGSLEMNLNINAKTHEAKLDFTFNDNENGDKTTASGSFTVSPSDEKVNPTKPANAESFENVLQDLGFNIDGSLNNSNSAVAEARQKSSDADVESTAFTVRSKLGVYYADHVAYPADIQAVDDWLKSAEGGNNAELAGKFTSANGFSYTASKTSFAIKYKLSDGSVKTVNNF